MNLIEESPEDILTVLLDTLTKISKVSIVVFAHINKFCYRVSAKYALQNNIGRPLKCELIASEGSLEVLQWARKTDCEWNWMTCAYAAQNGHLHVLQWARK